MDGKTKAIVWRFVRAFIAGAVASMSVVVGFSGSSWKELQTWLAGLLLACIVGGISGVIQATDKWFRMRNE